LPIGACQLPIVRWLKHSLESSRHGCRRVEDANQKVCVENLEIGSSAPPAIEEKQSGQLVRAGTSVGANYRAACRVVHARNLQQRLVSLRKEADESAFWLELII
jgi:four helix bundle protein